MAFDNSEVKSMNSPLIVLSLSHDCTAGSDTGGFWVVSSSGLMVPVYGLLVVLLCWLSVVAIAGGPFKGGLAETLDNISAGSWCLEAGSC